MMWVKTNLEIMIHLEMKHMFNKMMELIMHLKILFFQRMILLVQLSILNIDKIKRLNINVLNQFLKMMLNLKKIHIKVIMPLLKDIYLHKYEIRAKKMKKTRIIY
jgi:hypothetical protein